MLFLYLREEERLVCADTIIKLSTANHYITEFALKGTSGKSCNSMCDATEETAPHFLTHPADH